MTDQTARIAEIVNGIRRRVSQAPPALGYLFMPREWMKDAADLLTAQQAALAEWTVLFVENYGFANAADVEAALKADRAALEGLRAANDQLSTALEEARRRRDILLEAIDELLLSLRRIHMTARRALSFGRQATPHAPDAMVERRDFFLRHIVGMCEDAGVESSSVLRVDEALDHQGSEDSLAAEAVTGEDTTFESWLRRQVTAARKPLGHHAFGDALLLQGILDKYGEYARRTSPPTGASCPSCRAKAVNDENRALKEAQDDAQANWQSVKTWKARAEAAEAALKAARDVLAAFGKQAGYLPEQQGYATRMTDAEHRLAQAVADIDRLLSEAHG